MSMSSFAAVLTTLASVQSAHSTIPMVSSAGALTFPLLTHEHVSNRRRRELNSSSSWDRLPLQRSLQSQPAQQQLGSLYQGYGTHYIDIWVGYPPQRQTAVVDTGSSATAFPCSTCTNCGRHTDQPFDEASSNSFHSITCSSTAASETSGRPYCMFGDCDESSQEGGLCLIHRDYDAGEDASGWTAYEAEDVAYAGGPHDQPIDLTVPPDEKEDELGSDPLHASEFSFLLRFGCQTAVKGYFEQQLASGVMGLDRRAQSFWGQMRASQVIHKAQFSLCFVRQPIASTVGTTAGAVTLGGVDPRLNITPMVFAKAMGDGNTASFKVRVRKLYLRESGGTSVMYDGKAKYHALAVNEETLNGQEQFNIDSGTTDTYLIAALSTEFRRVWKEITRQEYTNDPIKLSDVQLRKLPTVILQLIPHEGGVGDEVRPENPAEVPGLAGKIDFGTPNDVIFAIPSTHYMQHNAKDNTYTARLYLDRDDSMGNILGANAIMGHNVLFDLDAARIGFAESDCDYSSLIAVWGSASSLAKSPYTEEGSDASLEAESLSNTNKVGDEPNKICSSQKCQGFLVLTCAIIFILFFIFARRYVTRRDDSRKLNMVTASPEVEMNSAGKIGDFSNDRNRSTSASRKLVPPPPSYSDDRSRSKDRRSDREIQYHSSRSSSSHSRNDDTSPSHRTRDGRSHNSTVGSIHSNQSSRSHRSDRSSRSLSNQSSHVSIVSKSSSSSGRSRESQQQYRSRQSELYHHEGERNSRTRNRYSDSNDDSRRPPSIC